ncbi:MAG: autotransporter outer membrane beta-barrel domain-containing protein, partial [Thermoguttaceae bacterium]|nr:autotransporter outer membrane beta-barrel domain-containing protein [Thermoguttaceae bacterium]
MPQFHAQSPEPSIAPDAARTRRFGLRVCVALAVCAICAVADAQYFEGLGLFGQTPPAAPAVFRDLADWAPSSAPLDFAVQERFDAAIVRGANLSELPIAPLSGRVFGVADATFGRQDSQGYDAFRSGFKVDSYGANVGYDGRLGTRAVWGFGAQGRRVNISPAADTYDTRINSFGGNIHMAIFGPLWRVDLAFGTAKNWHTQRLSEFCANKFSTSQWNYEAEFGVRYDKGYTRIEPFLNF